MLEKRVKQCPLIMITVRTVQEEEELFRSNLSHKGNSGNGTIVSDPTLDARLDQYPHPPMKPEAKPLPPPCQEKKLDPAMGQRSSSSTSSYNKKDKTERCPSVSDENPSFQEGIISCHIQTTKKHMR